MSLQFHSKQEFLSFLSKNGISLSGSGSSSGVSNQVTLTSGNTLTAAQANTAAIQAALSSGGTISFPFGTYYVTGSPLQAVSLSTIDLTGCHLITYGTGSCYNMFQNANYNATKLTISAVAYSIPGTGNPGNHRIQAAFTLNATTGLSVGGYLEVNGDSTGYAMGFWPILSIVGNTVTVVMFNPGALPANQSSVSWDAYAADAYIEFKNGIIDLNYSSGLITGTQNSYTEHGVAFNHVLKLKMKGTEIRDCSLYAFCSAHTQYPEIDIIINSRLDGIKIYGPNFVYVDAKASGTSGDDKISFQTADSAPYDVRMPPNAGGSFYGGGNGFVKDQWCGYSGGFVLYPNGGISSQQNFWMYGTYTSNGAGDSITELMSNAASFTSACLSIGNSGQPMSYASGIDKVVWQNPTGYISADNGAAGITVGSLVIDNWLNKVGSQSNICLTLGISCNSVVLNSPSFEPLAATSALVLYGITPKAYASIGQLVVNNPKLKGNTNIQISLIDPVTYTGTINQIVINNPSLDSTLGQARILNTNGSFANTPNIIINNPDLSSTTNNPITYGGTGAIDITMQGGKFNSSSTPFNFYGSGLVTLTGGDVNENGTPGLFANSTNVKFKKWRRGSIPTYYTPTTGQTVTLSVKTGDESCIINPAGALAALTIGFPANASSIDGETREIRITQAITTLSSSGGTVLGLPTTTVAGFSRTFIYNATASAWM